MLFSIKPDLINALSKDYNITTELFSSPLNNTLPKYCSAFGDLEKYFGSEGNFFNYIMGIPSGVYEVNPPFIERLMNNTILEILRALKYRTKVSFIVFLPAWDLKSRELLHEELYEDFQAIHYIYAHPQYIHFHALIPKNKMEYYDYLKEKLIKNVVATHVFVLSNDPTFTSDTPSLQTLKALSIPIPPETYKNVPTGQE